MGRRKQPGRIQPPQLPMDRPSVVYRMRRHLERFDYPRLQLSLLIGFAGIAAFLVSSALLSAGVESMAPRYGAAGVAGYLAFLGCVRVWIAWKRHAFRPELDIDLGHALEGIDVATDVFRRPATGLFDGGQSGGAGASGSWLDVRGGGSSRGGGGSSWFDDAGESLFMILLLIAALVGGVIAIGYVVYLAPALLAEVFVDAVIIAAVSKRVAGSERRDWTATLLRRTWFPAFALVALLVVAGWSLQRLAPDARSIGPAIEQIRR